MAKSKSLFDFFYSSLLSEKIREKSEVIIISAAIISFIVHLLLVVLANLKLIQLNDHSGLFSNPVAAIYTPFSLILIYEVYLLVYYLPKSTTIYIGKQYEIITLIVIRRLFKDLANLEFTADWFKTTHDLQFTYDLIATVILFSLIYLFYRLNAPKEKAASKENHLAQEIVKFIRMKNIIAMSLIPVFFILAISSIPSLPYIISRYPFLSLPIPCSDDTVQTSEIPFL